MNFILLFFFVCLFVSPFCSWFTPNVYQIVQTKINLEPVLLLPLKQNSKHRNSAMRRDYNNKNNGCAINWIKKQQKQLLLRQQEKTNVKLPTKRLVKIFYPDCMHERHWISRYRFFHKLFHRLSTHLCRLFCWFCTSICSLMYLIHYIRWIERLRLPLLLVCLLCV